MPGKVDTRAVGLDAGLGLVRWLTGAEHLHYGVWDGIEPGAANLGAAQEAYTARLLGHLPEGRLRILDIGGGAGETAARLTDLGHRVDIVVPSSLLADRCRANAPVATVHETRFEDFEASGPFDLCLFSESFQYVPLHVGLARAAELLAPGAHVLLADCFRSEAFRKMPHDTVGGGHRVTAFRETLSALPFEVVAEEDLTESVAPSVEIEQAFYNVIGGALTRLDAELSAKRPVARWAFRGFWRLALSRRRRTRLRRRLLENTRNAETFVRMNRYLLVKLRRTP